MSPTPIIDMFSGTGELARKYLKHRFPDAEVRKDFRDQIVPEGSIVTIGAPCQDLSVAGDRAWGLTLKQRNDVKRRYREKHRNGNGHGETISSVLSRDLEDEEIRLIQTWETVTGVYAPPTGLPDVLGLSVSAQRRLAGNAVVGLQARLMLQRGLTATNDTKGNL